MTTTMPKWVLTPEKRLHSVGRDQSLGRMSTATYRRRRGLTQLRMIRGSGPRGIAALSLLFCSGTLVCCALPAALVLLGAGSVMATLLSWIPGLVVFSQQKALVFGAAALALVMAGFGLHRSANKRSCSIDPVEAGRCRRRLRQARWLYVVSCSAFLTGGTVAYVLPMMQVTH